MHTVALTEDGRVFTWGNGGTGALGHGDVENQALPREVEGLKEHKIVKVDCGSEHTIVLTDKGKLFAFGNNRYGQLGVQGQNSVQLNSPEKISIPLNIGKVKDFACGEDHNAYICHKGNLYTWGYN